MFGNKKEAEPGSPGLMTIPIICKFVMEDGVWNATTEHLPIAAFGDTFEDAQKNLGDAIMSHLDSLARADKADEVVRHLREKAHEYLPIDEITPDSPIVKMLVGVRNREFMTVTA